MFVILFVDTELNTTAEIYSEGLYNAKNDLKAYVREKYDLSRILAYNYDLSKFDKSQTILRFADEKEHSIDVIEIDMVEQYGFNYMLGYEPEQIISTIGTYRLVEVHPRKREELPESIPSPPELASRVEHFVVGSHDPMEKLMKEMMQHRRHVKRYQDTIEEDSWSDF